MLRRGDGTPSRQRPLNHHGCKTLSLTVTCISLMFIRPVESDIYQSHLSDDVLVIQMSCHHAVTTSVESFNNFLRLFDKMLM